MSDIHFGTTESKDPVITFHEDGRITFGAHLTPADGAKEAFDSLLNMAKSQNDQIAALESRAEQAEAEVARLQSVVDGIASGRRDWGRICVVRRRFDAGRFAERDAAYARGMVKPLVWDTFHRHDDITPGGYPYEGAKTPFGTIEITDNNPFQPGMGFTYRYEDRFVPEDCSFFPTREAAKAAAQADYKARILAALKGTTKRGTE